MRIKGSSTLKFVAALGFCGLLLGLTGARAGAPRARPIARRMLWAPRGARRRLSQLRRLSPDVLPVELLLG